MNLFYVDGGTRRLDHIISDQIERDCSEVDTIEGLRSRKSLLWP